MHGETALSYKSQGDHDKFCRFTCQIVYVNENVKSIQPQQAEDLPPGSGVRFKFPHNYSPSWIRPGGSKASLALTVDVSHALFCFGRASLRRFYTPLSATAFKWNMQTGKTSNTLLNVLFRTATRLGVKTLRSVRGLWREYKHALGIKWQDGGAKGSTGVTASVALPYLGPTIE